MRGGLPQTSWIYYATPMDSLLEVSGRDFKAYDETAYKYDIITTAQDVYIDTNHSYDDTASGIATFTVSVDIEPSEEEIKKRGTALKNWIKSDPGKRNIYFPKTGISIFDEPTSDEYFIRFHTDGLYREMLKDERYMAKLENDGIVFSTIGGLIRNVTFTARMWPNAVLDEANAMERRMREFAHERKRART